MDSVFINLIYLAASVLFILGIRGLTHPRTAVRGNLLGATGMSSRSWRRSSTGRSSAPDRRHTR